ncbi:MAG TPA: hypothetical protein PKA28_04805 [Methylomusa anaerophila]|uniref:PRTase-CE domain-containing protein n=1 Tax=Methylomusa anaerophila TaxID=1930071 RepID=A0A348AMD8_9FIRM|nr:hypothetical protein [Methylomusa anaerophila]BBB92236.1 hypothetical protein MAMMFC1_02921 [Methylomusa anaerophila]HML87749.1 hypothetical protein [Methylomusa anaerophila]
MTEETIKLHINKYKSYVDFMLSQQQWSGLTKVEVEQWLSNFRDLNLQEKYLVYKLLTNLIYYSEKDVLDALREGIFNCLFYEIVLSKQISADFGLSQQALSNIIRNELRNTCFIPLLDSNSPHESGNYVTRLLVQQGLIHTDQSMFLDKVVSAFQSRVFSHLVIVDDCVGSGDQLRTFWNEAQVSVENRPVLLKTFCSDNNINANYLTLFAYDQSIVTLKQECPNLKICCVRTLSDMHRVFSDSSYVWASEAERQAAYELFSGLTTNNGISLYGYKGLDFAFIMHQTIPDWTLPLLWQENADWKLLMRRKNSDA